MEKIKPVPICNNYEFRRVYSKGKYYVSPAVVVYVLKNRYHMVRVGITTSKKIGNAVKRNRSRRIIRAALDLFLPYIRPGYDLVFVARGKTPFLKSTDIEKSLRFLFRKADILQKDLIQDMIKMGEKGKKQP